MKLADQIERLETIDERLLEIQRETADLQTQRENIVTVAHYLLDEGDSSGDIITDFVMRHHNSRDPKDQRQYRIIETLVNNSIEHKVLITEKTKQPLDDERMLLLNEKNSGLEAKYTLGKIEGPLEFNLKKGVITIPSSHYVTFTSIGYEEPVEVRDGPIIIDGKKPFYQGIPISETNNQTFRIRVGNEVSKRFLSEGTYPKNYIEACLQLGLSIPQGGLPTEIKNDLYQTLKKAQEYYKKILSLSSSTETELLLFAGQARGQQTSTLTDATEGSEEFKKKIEAYLSHLLPVLDYAEEKGYTRVQQDIKVSGDVILNPYKEFAKIPKSYF